MSAAGFAMLAVAVLVAYEAFKHLQVASASSSGAPSGPATSPSLSAGQSSGGSGSLLPSSWYQAVLANESPGATFPGPAFGFVAWDGLPQGVFKSGGSPEASAALGLPPGYTKQAIFPDVTTAFSAFDSTISKSGCLGYVSQGCMAFFTCLAPKYAGPGEYATWPGQICGRVG